MPPRDDPATLPAYSPPPLPYPLAVAPLLGRPGFVWHADGRPVRSRLLPPGPEAGDVALRFSWDGAEGSCVLPRAVAEFLLRTVEPDPLGPHAPDTAALLAEYALAEPLEALEAAFGGRFALLSMGPDLGGADLVPLVLACETGEESFPATLRLPPALFARVAALAPALLPVAAPSPPVVVAARIGLSRLAPETVASLRPGDALIPQIMLAPDRALLVVGERRVAPARMDGTCLVLDDAPAPALASWGEWIVSSEDEQEEGSIAPEDTTLGDLRITLVFELARRTLALAEVQGLAEGHVIELGSLAEASVSVLANGARLGRGELVRVGDRLAVRLSRIAAS